MPISAGICAVEYTRTYPCYTASMFMSSQPPIPGHNTNARPLTGGHRASRHPCPAVPRQPPCRAGGLQLWRAHDLYGSRAPGQSESMCNRLLVDSLMGYEGCLKSTIRSSLPHMRTRFGVSGWIWDQHILMSALSVLNSMSRQYTRIDRQPVTRAS